VALLFVSIVASATVLERMVFWSRTRRRTARRSRAWGRPSTVDSTSDPDEPYHTGLRRARPVLSHRESLPGALLYINSREISASRRGPILDTVITLAPLLGFWVRSRG
jgi:biopolymer transport protein ExbB/TolQ